MCSYNIDERVLIAQSGSWLSTRFHDKKDGNRRSDDRWKVIRVVRRELQLTRLLERPFLIRQDSALGSCAVPYLASDDMDML